MYFEKIIPSPSKFIYLSATLGLIILVIQPPSWAYRLDRENGEGKQKPLISSGAAKSSLSSSASASLSKKSVSESAANNLLEGWPPRIPMWGFLSGSSVSKVGGGPATHEESDLESLTSSNEEGEEISNHLEFLPSLSASHQRQIHHHQQQQNHISPLQPQQQHTYPSQLNPTQLEEQERIQEKIHQHQNENDHHHQQQQKQQRLLSTPHEQEGVRGVGADIEGPLANDDLEGEEEPWITNLKRSTGVSRTNQGVKRTRNYDVPQIECPPADDGMERFSCPTPDNLGRYRCVDDHVLCDGFVDCPGREDEDRQACMFYKTTKAHLDVLADALLRWARG